MVKLIVDSASDINEAEAKKRGFIMVPMQITIDGKTYKDGVDITSKDFFEILEASETFPQTSQINEYTWQETFDGVVKNGDEAVVVCISSKLSGSCFQAKKAAEKFNNKIFVVDSMNVCIGERLLIDLAERLIKEGESAKEVAEVLEEKKSSIKLLALLDTLKYLKKGGRISSLVAFTGEILKVKPVVAVVDGEVKLVGKAVGSKKANNLLMTMVQKTNGIDFDLPFCTAYSGLDDSLLKRYIEDSAVLWEDKTSSIKSYSIGSTIGTHVGPGAIAVAFF